MSETQALPLGDVLSVTDGHLVSRDHIGGVYRVCDYMTGEANMTHQLPRVSEECRPEILRQHPWLADVKAPEWDKPTKEDVMAWLTEQEAKYGETVELSPLAAVDHTSIDPIMEAGMMGFGPDRIIPVVIDAESPSGE